MNYGLYLSASGVLTNMYRQDVLANNLANVETAGFKADLASIRQRDPESIEDRLGLDASQPLLDRLGGGALAGPQQVRFQPGPLTQTGNPLDAAFSDEGSFFVVQATDPQSGRVEARYTRDGRFSLNAAGELVTHQGRRVLGTDGQPIAVPRDQSVEIEADGRIVTREGGEEVGRIGVVRVPDTDKLLKQGGGLFAYRGHAAPEPVDQPVIHPGHIEGSGVDPIRTLMGITSASKAVSANADMIRHFDRLMEQAVGFGKVA